MSSNKLPLTLLLMDAGFWVQSTHGMRPGGDDVDAQIRLPGLLNDSYYRNVLCEYGAFFAIANRIDQVHRNAWIGFQPWRAASRNVSWAPVNPSII
jgi:hypothetical protein